MLNRTIVTRVGATVFASAAAGLLVAGPASAHVSITPTTTTAGSYTVLAVSVPHGCETSPTTKFTIQIPEGIYSVTPTRNAFYNVAKKIEVLAEPVTDANGNEITEKVSAVVYTAKTPLPSDQRDVVELSLQLPDAEGETLVFPVIQKCAKGVNEWVEVAAEGQDPHELERPAPSVTITAAEAEHGAEAEEAPAEEPAETEPEAAAPATNDGANGLSIAALVAGLGGLVAGGSALMRGRGNA